MGDFGGENGYMRRILEGNKLMMGNYPSSRQHRGPARRFAHFCFVRSPEHASESRGWPGLAGWMKAQIRAKTRNRGRDWAEYRRPDEKIGCRGPNQGVAGDALK
jgi:hypothetical protein